MSTKNPTGDQRRAIESWQRGDVCVVAGPGSGKTFVLVERYKWLVCERRVPPHRILAITFTNKAADNMRRRLVESFPPGSPERQSVERAWISTIDAFCARLLRENAIEAAVDPEFRVLDQWEADSELRRAIEETLEQEYRARLSHVREFLRTFAGNDAHACLFDLYQAVRAAGVSVSDAARITPAATSSQRWVAEVFGAIDERYRQAKRQAGALDYADLAEHAIALLKKTNKRAAESFSFILMDELQDTSPLQARLLALLRRPGNFFAVGDINQSIYGFRHADPAVFAEFRKQAGDTVDLPENFRSRPEILSAIEQIMGRTAGFEPHRLRAARQFPTATVPCLEIFIVRGGDNDETQRREAEHVAERIAQLHGRLLLRSGPAEYGSFAILTKTSGQARIFERALRQHGIPCQVTEGRGFYEASEIRDLLHFLRLLLNPLDEISLAAVLRSPLAGVSDDTLLRLKMASPSLFEGMQRAQDLSPVEEQKLEIFRGRLERYRSERDSVPLDRLLGRLLAESGYEAWLLQQPGGAHKTANIRKFLALARRFHASGVSTLRDFVDRVEDLRRQEAREAEAEPPEQSSDAVQVMTVHSAKGLEFPVVVVPCINRRWRADLEAMRFSATHGIGVKWRSAAGEEGEWDAAGEAISSERKARRAAESQRLFYVAMTRAEELLVLSASFGSQVRRDEWARNLADNLSLDLKQIDNTPRAVTLNGCRVRLLQANQEPAPTPAPAVERAALAPVVWLERLPAGHQPDASVAVSSVALFAQCPRKYYLSRYLGFDQAARTLPDDDFPPPAPDEMDSTEFGRHVHAVLAGTVLRENARPEALALADSFASSPWGRRASAARRVEREQSFLFDLDGRLIRGQIDLWFEDDDGVVIIDYKADQVSTAEAPLRAAEYELQLRLYALAVERLAGARPSRALVCFLRPNVAIDICLDDTSLDAARRAVADLFDAQAANNFPLRVGEHCHRCPHFAGLCPATQSEITKSLNLQIAKASVLS